MSSLNVTSLKFPSVLCVQESVCCTGVCCVLEENIRKEQQANKISLHEEAMVLVEQVQVFLTVLLDFHGSNDKTGLGDRGKTRGDKSLRFWTVTPVQPHVTSPLCPQAPTMHLEGLRPGDAHTANILPNPLSLVNSRELMDKFPKALQTLKPMQH